MLDFIAVITIAFTAASDSAAPIRKRPALETPFLVGQKLTIDVNGDGELILPGAPKPDLNSYLASQLERIKKVAEKNKEQFAPVLVVRVPTDIQYRDVIRIIGASQRIGFDPVHLDSGKKR